MMDGKIVQARLYDPLLGRFVQPDTIVSNPLNPQSLNRYTYVLNNPVMKVDPTGHYDADYDELLSHYNVTLDSALTKREKRHIYWAVRKVGQRFGGILDLVGNEAFKAVYGYMHFKECSGTKCPYGDEKNEDGSYKLDENGDRIPYYITAGMVTNSRHEIGLASVYGGPSRANNNVIHELGHAFNLALNGLPANTINTILYGEHPELRRDKGLGRSSGHGFYSEEIAWSQALINTFGWPSEEFADSFLAWVWNIYEYEGGITTNGQYRRDFMNFWMPIWINMLANPYGGNPYGYD